ncbi:MAG: ABC transporter ATP-binding protein [Deltaproteobacteria bacterium]|nr:ABC transporter ATP-binding protein [Deltaproteobacteria bacterium]
MEPLITTKKTFIDPRSLPAVRGATLRRILSYLRPHRRDAAVVVLAVLAQASLGLVPALLVKELIDTALPQAKVGALALLSIGMVVAPLVSALIGVGKKYLTERIGERLMLDLRIELFRHVHRQSLDYFTHARPGEAISHVLNDVQGVGSTMSGTMVTLVDAVLVLGTTAALLFALDVRLAIVALVILPVFAFPTRRVGRKKKALKRESQALLAEITGILAETLSVSGALLLKIFGSEEHAIKRLRVKSTELMALSLRQTLVGRWFQMLIGLFESIGPALVYGVGGWLVIRGEAPLGTIVAFVALLKRLYSPASSLAGIHVDVVTSYAYFDRIFEVLDRAPSVEDRQGAIALDSVEGSLSFRHVTFAYRGAEAALVDVDFEVSAGETIAIVGPSGAGKSTVAALIPRLYDPSEGAVLLDGRDLREIRLESLRAQIGIVTQDPFLFHASVADNLRYAKPDATQAELEAAARAAHIHDVVCALPEGYDTLVGDRGYRLSGGERQRVAIARVVLKNPRILILDEAMSSLDAPNQELVQESLEKLRQGRTTVVIAHRLSAIRHTDEVVVLDRGRIVERGRHEELLTRGGLYAALYHG